MLGSGPLPYGSAAEELAGLVVVELVGREERPPVLLRGRAGCIGVAIGVL